MYSKLIMKYLDGLVLFVEDDLQPLTLGLILILTKLRLYFSSINLVIDWITIRLLYYINRYILEWILFFHAISWDDDLG